MIDKLLPSSRDRAAARAFADKIEPISGLLDQEFVPRPPKRSREEIDQLTAELFETIAKGQGERKAGRG